MKSKTSPTSADARAFTLIELLVVIGIIGVLAGLLVGTLGGARFKARVTSCANNYRQWGVSVALYASDDKMGRLPSLSLPLAKFSGYGELSPWFVPLGMARQMEPYGIGVNQWFCPARASSFERASKNFTLRNPGRRLNDIASLTQHWEEEFKFFGDMEHNWFVPRTLEGSDQLFPDPKVVTSREPAGWPRRMEDPVGATQPILTDWVLGVWNDEKTAINISGGHEFPRFFTRNINLLFVDGHVENRSKSKLIWQINFPRDFVIPY